MITHDNVAYTTNDIVTISSNSPLANIPSDSTGNVDVSIHGNIAYGTANTREADLPHCEYEEIADSTGTEDVTIHGNIAYGTANTREADFPCYD